MWRTTVLLVACLAAFAGCGDKTGPTPNTPEGSWSGTTTDGTVIALTLTESSGTVTGAGTFTTTAQSVPLQATGSYAAPHLSLTLSAQGFNNMNLSTTVGASSMAGVLNGSGFLNEAVSFQRH